MQELMLADTPVEQREQILRDSCDQIVEKSYTRKFEQGEINERRELLCDRSIQIAELEDELAGVKAEYKAKINPLKEQLAKLRAELKQGGEYVKGDCFKFVDEEEGVVGFYSPEGYLLEQRTMNPDERQRNIFREVRKNGTDN